MFCHTCVLGTPTPRISYKMMMSRLRIARGLMVCPTDPITRLNTTLNNRYRSGVATSDNREK